MTRTRVEAILPSEVIENLEERVQSLQPPDVPTEQPSGPEPLTPINDTYSGTLDDAASLLLRQLSPAIRDFAFELADITLKVPRWQLILGTILSQYESGNLQAPSIDPAWRQMEIAVKQSICQYHKCRKEFSPKRYGQSYCSPQCGDEVRREEIAKVRAERENELKFRKAVDRVASGGILS